MGASDYIKWRSFRQDISYWEGGDRGATSKNIVKYWTLLLIFGAIAAWIWFLTASNGGENTTSGLIVVTLIAIDVLHPCTYLWLGEALEEWNAAKANIQTWRHKLTAGVWW